jgi:hypothetical protein
MVMSLLASESKPVLLSTDEMIVMILGYTGSRKGMTHMQREHLVRTLTHNGNISEIHHGCCQGADEELHRMLLTNPGITKTIVCHPPENDVYQMSMAWLNVQSLVKVIRLPKKPYIMRNHDIVNECDLLVACPNGFEVTRSGTWATVRYAVKQKKCVKIIYPDGLLEWR